MARSGRPRAKKQRLKKRVTVFIPNYVWLAFQQFFTAGKKLSSSFYRGKKVFLFNALGSEVQQTFGVQDSEIKTLPLLPVSTSKTWYANARMAYQLIGAYCTGCGHDGDERKGTFYAYITRVIEKSTPSCVSLDDDLCKRAMPDDAAGVMLILDC